MQSWVYIHAFGSFDLGCAPRGMAGYALMARTGSSGRGRGLGGGRSTGSAPQAAGSASACPLVPVWLLPGSAAPGGFARPRPRRWAREGLHRLDAWTPGRLDARLHRQARALPLSRNLPGHLRPDLAKIESQLRAGVPVGPLYGIHSPLNQSTNVAGWSLPDTSPHTHLTGDFFLSCLRAAVRTLLVGREHLGSEATFLPSFLDGEPPPQFLGHLGAWPW